MKEEFLLCDVNRRVLPIQCDVRNLLSDRFHHYPHAISRSEIVSRQRVIFTEGRDSS